MDAKIIPMNKENKETITREEAKQILDNILTTEEGTLDPALGTFGDMDSILTILSLPDNEFRVMSEIVIQEMEKACNNPNDRLLLIQNLTAAGVKAEDLIEEYQKVIDQLEEIKDSFPLNRIGFLKRIMIVIINAVAETEGIPKRTINIPIELCHEDAKMPAYAKVGDAGMDVFALKDITINPGETKIIPIGIKVAIPSGYELQVRPKSGRAARTKLRVANTPGTIDSGYRDEVGVIIENIEPNIADLTYDFDDDGKPVITSILHGKSYTICKGEKFAQLVLSEVPTATWTQVDTIEAFEGNRGGGFGSTGLK